MLNCNVYDAQEQKVLLKLKVTGIAVTVIVNGASYFIHPSIISPGQWGDYCKILTGSSQV